MEQSQTMNCSPNEAGVTNPSSPVLNSLQVAFLWFQPKSMPQKSPLTSCGEYDGG